MLKNEDVILYPSDLESFLRCPYQYYLYRIEKIPGRKSMALLEGRVFHKAVENDLRAEKKLEESALKELAIQLLNAEIEKEQGLIDYVDDPAVEFQNSLSNIYSYLGQYYKIRSEKYFDAVVAEEEEAKMDYEKFILKGRIDIRSSKGFIELKTKKIAPKTYNSQTSLQMNCYALLFKMIYGFIPEGMIFFFTPKMTTYFIYEWNSKIIEKTEQILYKIAEAIEKRVFIPAPQDESNWSCSYCNWKYVCEYTLRI